MSSLSIAVINTGGTISCTGNPLTPMSATAFAAASGRILTPVVLQQFPGLTVDYITDLPFPESASQTLDSTNLQPTDWCLIAGYILSHYARYDGWVVLHGTDSMDFTGAALPFLLSVFSDRGYPVAALSKPIVITGSQVPMYYQDPVTSALSLNFDTDAFQNFCGAIAAAQTGIPEVCVYFDDKLMRGNRVEKTNASEFDAFSSPNYPILGESGISLSIAQDAVLPPPVSSNISLDDPTALAAAQAQLAYLQANLDSFPVMQLNAFPAWYKFDTQKKTCSGLLASLIDAVVGTGLKGLILESYGEGNFPSGNPDSPQDGATYQALKRAHSQGVTIVNCTQVLRGVVNDSAYAAGAWLPDVGALSPADMTPMAALAKAMILLCSAGYQKWSASTVDTLIQLNLLGEMRDVSRLDSRTGAALLPGQALTSLDGSAVLVNDADLGPVLRDRQGGAPLWRALSAANPATMPGRLIMQNDGNLVFYSRYNAPLWATDTGVASGASSTLSLDGSLGDGSLSLTVYDYSRGKTTARLYP
ncbi:MAG: asparaginase domain-containing protein [Kofleriaceae bacterium]